MVEPADPGGRRSPAKRRAILDAAFEVFCAQGYARTSVDAIAAEAGVGKQTVYGHFGDKKNLFLATVDDARSALPALDELITDTGDPFADLTAAGERILRVVASPRVSALHRLTIAELRHHPELQRAWRDSADPALDRGIASYLRACHEAGTLAVPDPVRAARQFTYVMVTEARVATLWGHEPLAGPLRRNIAAAAADLIVRAYRP
ncbi:TetR/AcrR family transcriptional regulator [Pseudonocardia acaciae]|uniref:TetR/AcrR family transcriptional regulator n=1 Tax=Pseudonocardia acaciae TaxID=551276 RepID=UPI00055DBA1B|nr:TetR/AcrR family transcriptional regulator [Pseudonocardia acaciae]